MDVVCGYDGHVKGRYLPVQVDLTNGQETDSVRTDPDQNAGIE